MDCKLFLGKNDTQNFWEKMENKKYTSKIQKVPKNSIKYLFLTFFCRYRIFSSEWLANFSWEKKYTKFLREKWKIKNTPPKFENSRKTAESTFLSFFCRYLIFFELVACKLFLGKMFVFFSKKWRKKYKILSNRVSEWGVNYYREKKKSVPLFTE